MPKLRRQRKRQKFRYDRNRKRIKKTQEKHQKDKIKVNNDVIKDLWNPKESIKNNLESMGVAFDANKVVDKKSIKQQFIEKLQEANPNEIPPPAIAVKKSSEVVKRLEAEVLEAETNKTPKFRFTGEQVKWITYCLDKHGDDFKAMARDPKNIWQETPKQIRQKVLKFVSIPEQFAVYAKKIGLLDDAAETDGQ